MSKQRFLRASRAWLSLALIAVSVFTFNALGLLMLPLVGMALTKARTRINVKGGGLLKLREISPTQTDAFVDAGYLGGTDLNDEHSMLEIVDEVGNLVDALSGARKAVLTTTLKQTTLDEINLIKNASGKYYDAYYYVKLANTYVQELTAIPCKIKPGPVLTFKSATERTIQVTIYFLAPKATATRAPTAYNVTVDEPYVLIENAAAQGAPTEATSTFATLISAVL